MLLRTLGGLALPGVSFRRQKPLLLLGYLATEGPKDRRYLAELFWPRAANPRQSLAVALSQLRAAADNSVLTDGARLWTQLESDAGLLRAAAMQGDWRQVIDLYKGPFCAGVGQEAAGPELEEWLYGTREQLAGLAQRALVIAGETAASGGDLGAAGRHAEQAAKLAADTSLDDPRLVARLHTLLTLTNNPRADTVWHEAEELGMSLPPQPTEPARQATPKETRHNLAQIMAPFVGRDEELRDLRRLLDDSARMLVITGLGGMGKTRLALALARTLVEAGTYDQVFFVPLETAVSESDVLARMVSVMALPTDQEPLATLRDALWNNRTLLVLDDFEQVAHAAPLLLELLQECPHCRLVITSREPLGTLLEAHYPLSGLRLPGALSEDMSRADLYGGLELYELTAKRYDPRFALGPDNTESVLAICRMLAGSPLGIELAAALARCLPAAELERMLAEDLDALEGALPGMPERHAGLRAVFERSWGLLDPAEQAAIAACSVFHGGFGRSDAAALLGLDLRRLAGLLDKGLVWRLGGRYDLHPLVKQYAREKLAALPSGEDLRALHAEHYCALLESKRPFSQRAGQDAAFAELDVAYANLRAAWEWAVAARRHDLLERMVTMFSSYLLNRNRRSEHEALLDAALESAPPGTLLMARLLREKARRLRSTRAAEALHLLEQALELARRNGAQGDLALALNELGLAHFFLGDMAPARTLWREALTLMEDQDDALRLSSCLQNLAMVTVEKGEHERLLQQAIAAGEKHGDQLGLSASLTKYAVFLKTAYGDAAEARRLQAKVVEMERDLGNLENQMRALCAVSCYEVQLGDLRGAERSLAEAAETGARLDSAEPRRVTAFQGDLDFGLALVHFSRGRLDTARWHAERSGSVLKALEVLAWIASYEGDAGRLAELIQQIEQRRTTDQIVPRYLLYYDALTSLLVADLAYLTGACDGAEGATGGADGELRARSALASALRITSQYVFLPLAMDVFLVACRVAPAETGTTLLELVRDHPASRFHTQHQAEELLAGTPLGWEQRLPGAPRQGGNRVPPIGEVLALGADLAGRLSGASRRVKVAL